MTKTNNDFLLHWISTENVWELGVAVKLLLGIDPESNPDKVKKTGNEDLTRVYMWAIKHIKEGKLTAVSETPLDTGEVEYRVRRDDFIEWARANKYDKKWIDPLYKSWKAYKASKGKGLSEKELRRQRWQDLLDKKYIKAYKTKQKHPTHTSLCHKLAEDNYPAGSTIYNSIRKDTRHRSLEWVIGKFGKMKNSQPGKLSE